jgi:hypothetical protein
MLGQRFANPHIFAIVSANEQDEVVSGGIVGM